MDHDRAVTERYSAAAQAAEPGLCCPVAYDPHYLAVIPPEVLDRDYGCGDPVSHVRPGEWVLDLGSGTGKVCFIAAQITGPAGSVLGVDLNEDMLAVARTAQSEVARRLGYGNVTFARARIEDLSLDLEFLDRHLARHPVRCHRELAQLEELCGRLRQDSPLVPDGSVDVVISNCVLNLVSPSRKPAMFAEIGRVLRPGGRAVISDIVSDVDVPAVLRDDPVSWSGCYSGAMREDRFLDGLIQAGLTGLTVLKRDAQPWHKAAGAEFRSITVASHKLPQSGVAVRQVTVPARSVCAPAGATSPGAMPRAAAAGTPRQRQTSQNRQGRRSGPTKPKEFAVDFDTVAIDEVLHSVLDLGLLSETERKELLFALTPEFLFADAVKMTESVHAHVKVTDTALLPDEKLRALGYRPENGRPGYIKYGTDAKINLIFSSIPIAADDGIPGAVTLAKPFMDHVGIDMRDETPPTRAVFDSIPGRAAELGWREVTQAGPVHCCHTEVMSKHWAYPPEGAGWRRPVEFAFGTLKVFTEKMGCDLRPIDPGHPLAGGPAPCCGASASAPSATATTCGGTAEQAADVTAAS